MCVSFPARVVAVDERGATVEGDGRTRRASTLLYPEIAPGEWVMVAAGTIVQRLNAEEAEEIRSALLEALRLVEREKGVDDAAPS